MLNPDNYNDYKDISINQQPRVSGLFGNLSRTRLTEYENYCIHSGDEEKAALVLKKMNEFMPMSIFPPDSKLKEDIEQISKRLKN